MRTGLLPIVTLLLIGLMQSSAAPEPETDSGAASATPTTQPEPAATQPEAAPDKPPDRVIIQLGRFNRIMGVVEDEDDLLMVVRDPEGELHSVTKSRVLKIVRLVNPEPGQTGVVVLQDGQRYSGAVIEDTFEHVILEVKGIRTRFVRDVVDYVVLNPTFQEQYDRMKRQLEQYSAPLHLEMCRWLIQNRRYDLAEKELAVLVRNADVPETVELLRVVRAQLKLQRQKDAESDESAESQDSQAREQRDPLDESWMPGGLLSDEDVNLIRVFEIDFADPPKVQIEPDTIRELIANYSESKLIPTSAEGRNAMFRADPLDITRLMFELRAREMYPQIRVLTEPASLNLFRLRVHNTWLINNCATSACHGGPDGGDFFLHRRRYLDENVRYTNLLILERLIVDEQWPLINYDQPMMSLIIQYGLPWNEARLRHPDVRGWKPVFNPGSRRMLDGTVRWIESMLQPRPAYPVEFDPNPPPTEPADPKDRQPR